VILKLFRKRLHHRVKIRLRSLFTPPPDTVVFILCTRRSGSNLLSSYLKSLPGVRMTSEMLHPRMYYGLRERFITRRAVLRHVKYSVRSLGGRVAGGKLMLDRVLGHGLQPSDIARRFRSARFLVTYRRSLADQYVSQRVAEATGRWQWAEDFRLPRPFVVDLGDFRAYCDRLRGKYESVMQAAVMRGRVLAVAYEDLAADAQGLFDARIFDFLGLSRCPVRTDMKKQLSLDPRRLVVNAAEFSAAASGPWAWLDLSGLNEVFFPQDVQERRVQLPAP
jgi:LPS sulfotransferase NodH